MNVYVGPTAASSPEPSGGSSSKDKPSGVPDHHEAPRRSIAGSLAHAWWRILLLWVVISMPVAYLIYATMGATYEAISRIQVEPTEASLFDQTRGGHNLDLKSYEPYLQTQVNLMQSDLVLNRAIAHESVANLALIARSDDPKTDLRRSMKFEIEPNTYMIDVSLQSKIPAEAATIVNAVVESYLDENNHFTQTRDQTLKASLKEQLDSLRDQVTKKRDELNELNQKRAVEIVKPRLNLPPKDGDDVMRPTFEVVGQQQIDATISQMVQIDLDLLAVKAELKARLDSQKGQQGAGLQRLQDENELETRLKEVWFADPEVKALEAKIKDLEDELARQKGVARPASSGTGDRALQALRREHARLKADWQALWKTKSEEVRTKFSLPTDGRPPTETVAQLQYKLKVLEEKRAGYIKMYQQQKVEQRITNDDSFQVDYAKQELAGLVNREDQVKRNLQQVEFASRQEQYRVVLVDKAEVPRVPVNNNRLKYMAIAPLAILFLLLAGFFVSTLSARRSPRVAVAPSMPPAMVPASREPASGADKLADLAYACRRHQEVQRSGGKVGLVEGRFDKIDYAVVHLLQFARNQGDFLIVGVETDASIERSHESGQSSVPQDQRAYLVSLYHFVDLVVAFDRNIPLSLIHAIRPDVVVTSGNAAPETVAGAEFVRSYGGRMAMCPRIANETT